MHYEILYTEITDLVNVVAEYPSGAAPYHGSTVIRYVFRVSFDIHISRQAWRVLVRLDVWRRTKTTPFCKIVSAGVTVRKETHIGKGGITSYLSEIMAKAVNRPLFKQRSQAGLPFSKSTSMQVKTISTVVGFLLSNEQSIKVPFLPITHPNLSLQTFLADFVSEDGPVLSPVRL